MSTVRAAKLDFSDLEVDFRGQSDGSKIVVYDNTLPEPVYPEANPPQWAGSETALRSKQPLRQRRILGLPCRIFASLLGVALAVIGAVVGVAVAGANTAYHNQGNSDSHSQPTATQNTTSTSALLANSTLAATNYTDTNGVIHRAVFFQDSNSALIGRFWNGSYWETVNITHQYPHDQILPGTPLTASALGVNKSLEVRVWCLLEDQLIQSYGWSGQAGDLMAQSEWVDDKLLGLHNRTVMQGSGLAAAWQRPWALGSNSSHTSGAWILAYQNMTGAIVSLNYTDTSSDSLIISNEAVDDSTSLAMDAEISGHAPSTMLLTLTYGFSGTIFKTSYGTAWDSSQTGSALFDVPRPPSRIQLASTPWSEDGKYLFLALLPNGTVTVTSYNNPGFNTIPSVSFTNGPNGATPSNFTSITTDCAGTFYGIANGSIYEFTIASENFNGFKYASSIYP